MIAPWTPPQPGLALFGKTKMRADFVALNVNFPAAERLRHWLEAGFEAAIQTGAHPNPSATWNFVVCEPDAEWAMVGLLTKGQDRVHREHPLWIGAPLPATLVRGPARSLVPLACERTFLAMNALLARLDSTPLTELKAALTGSPVPTVTDFARLEHAPRSPLASPEASELRAAWASGTVNLSTSETPSKLHDYPVASSAGVYCWLALHATHPTGAAPLSYFWSRHLGRLKLGGGPPNPAWFAQLLQQRHTAVARSAPPHEGASAAARAPEHTPDPLGSILEAVPDSAALDREEA